MRSYRQFLASMGNDLLEVLRVMENDQWHHEDVDTDHSVAYGYVGAVMEQIVERAVKYVDSKVTGEARVQAIRHAEAQDSLDRLLVLGQHRGERAIGAQHQLDDLNRDEAWIDGGSDDPEHRLPGGDSER